MNIIVRELSYSYPSMPRPAIENISLEAPEGGCTVILGTNGAGKSTLLKCISGILKCPRGTVFAGGRDIRSFDRREYARTVGYVSQQPEFSDETVFETVLMGRKPYFSFSPGKKDTAAAEEAICRAGLSSFAGRKVCELSGGERQKAAIARALAQQPKVLLLDEPTNNLDMGSRIAVRDIARRLAHTDGVAVIVTMHDINLALSFADRFILMKDTSVLASGGADIVTCEAIETLYGVKASVEALGKRTVVIPSDTAENI